MGLHFHFGVVFLFPLTISAVRVRKPLPTNASSATKVWGSCPYPYQFDETQGLMIGGSKPIDCHKMASGHGNTCPTLQQARLRAVRTYQAANYNDYLERARNFKLSPLFDKTEKVRGLESYEEMLHYHVQGLSHPDVEAIEDKILLKDLAQKLEVPATEMYFGAHKSDWDISKFKRTLGHLCLTGVDAFIIKAVHLAWSKGQKIVRNWQRDCPHEAETNSKLEEIAEFVDKEIMSQVASEADAHLREYVKPGVTMEALFATGGLSKRPLEAKIQVLWGKVHHIFFVGEDPRGCVSYAGAWSLFGDRTGWDFNGMRDDPLETHDEVSELVINKALEGMIASSEKFATAVGADIMRVDWFLGFRDDGSVDYKMNECESVSGARYHHERDGLGRAWVDGYVLSGHMQMTGEKWDRIVQDTEHARAANHLD